MLLHQLLGNQFQQVEQSLLTKQGSLEAPAQEAVCVLTFFGPLSKASLSLAIFLLSPFCGISSLAQ